jgi:diguanylate cyclase (GGDEF)-like protein
LLSQLRDGPSFKEGTTVVSEEGIVMSQDAIPITVSDWMAAQARTKRFLWVLTLGTTAVALGMCMVVVVIADAVATGGARWALTAGLLVLLTVPLAVGSTIATRKQQDRTDRMVGRLTQQLAEAVEIAGQQARRQEFESRLANALDMAGGEPEVIDVIERAFTMTLPGSPVELLLADNSRAHLTRMASTSPTGAAPGCSVDSPDHCPAARRAQVQQFAHSDDIDACPKLRGRIEGPVSSVCVPVSIMGRSVGVIHATAEPHTKLDDDAARDLGTLAKLAGARIGLLRVMADTQLQAATDSLTGLLNRRSFEQQVAKARRDPQLLTLAVGDLDHFKSLNDTYGHETGDRALRLFAQVMTGSVRQQDFVCRHGGEEFVLALAGCDTETARVILDALRGRLDAAITVAGLPKFTVSFGVVEALDQEDLPTLINRADTALFQAKREGRDRVVIQDAFGNVMPARSERTSLPDSDRIHLPRNEEADQPGFHFDATPAGDGDHAEYALDRQPRGRSLESNMTCGPGITSDVDPNDADLDGRRVEVAGDDDPGVPVCVEDLVDQSAVLQRLAHPLHRQEERSLGPAVGGSPGESVDLLSGDVGGDLGFQVHVDHVQGGPAGQG